MPEMPSFLAGKGKTAQADASAAMRSVSAPQPVNGFDASHDSNGNLPLSASHEQQDVQISNGPLPRMVGDGTRDSPIALLDDGDTKMVDDSHHNADAKRLKMANGSSVGVAPPSQSHSGPVSVKHENGDTTRKRKHSSIGVEVSLLLQSPLPVRC